MRCDLLDCAARLRAHRDRVLADLHRMGVEDWEIRGTLNRRGDLGLDELLAQLREVAEAKHEAIVRLMRAPGTAR